MAGGRPTTYTPELARRICDLVSSSPHGLQRIVDMHPDLPHLSTVYEWRHVHNEFSEDYLLAREKQAHLLFEASIDAIEELKDYMFTNQSTGAKDISAGIVAAQKALASQRSRQAAILNKRYRDDKGSPDQDLTATQAMNKIREMVADFNKTNVSDV